MVLTMQEQHRTDKEDDLSRSYKVGGGFVCLFCLTVWQSGTSCPLILKCSFGKEM